MRTRGVDMDDFDLVVLGAGAAGMMGALASSNTRRSNEKTSPFGAGFS